MGRALLEDRSLLKYSYRYVVERDVLRACATIDYSVVAKRYGEALRRLRGS